VPLFVFGEVSVDLYTFPADDRHYDEDQKFAPFAIRYEHQQGQLPYSTVAVRGKPSGGSGAWKARRAEPSTITEPEVIYSLNNFTRTDTATTATLSWDRGAKVDEVWVWSSSYNQSSVPAAPWPDPATADPGDATVLAVGTDSYDATIPSFGNVLYVQFEARKTDWTFGPGSNTVKRCIIQPNQVGTEGIVDLSVLEGKLADSAVTRAKILDGAVNDVKIAAAAITNAKLASDAVNTANVVAGAITEVKLASLAVSTAKLQVSAVTESILAASAVTETRIADNAISTAKLQAASVAAGKIAAGAVTATEIAALTIAAGNIASDAVTSAKIAAGAVVAGKLSAGAIDSTSIIASGIITDSLIATGTITGAKIAGLTITAANIAAATITGAKIAADTITADHIDVSSLSAISADLGTITAGTIGAAGSVGSSNYSAGSTGWQVNGSGDAEFNDVTVRGTVEVDLAGGDLIKFMNGSDRYATVDSFTNALGWGVEWTAYNSSNPVLGASVEIQYWTAGDMIWMSVDGIVDAASVFVSEELRHTGTKAGFYNTTPITKQTGVAVSAAGIHAALVNLGLIGT
jgi:hypothetical protein